MLIYPGYHQRSPVSARLCVRDEMDGRPESSRRVKSNTRRSPADKDKDGRRSKADRNRNSKYDKNNARSRSRQGSRQQWTICGFVSVLFSVIRIILYYIGLVCTWAKTKLFPVVKFSMNSLSMWVMLRWYRFFLDVQLIVRLGQSNPHQSENEHK